MTKNMTDTQKKTMAEQFSDALNGAVEAALWSTVPSSEKEDEMVEPADQYEIDEQELTKLRGTLAYFMKDWFLENYALVEKAHETLSWEAIGHDFWLTMEGHGAGFWDRGLEELGDDLTDSVTGYSDIVGLYLNDEGTHVLVDTYNVQDFNDNLFV